MRIFIFVLLCSTPSWAWKVEQVNGKAQVEALGSVSEVTSGLELKEGSVIQTGPGTRMRLSSADSTLSLGANTRLQIQVKDKTSEETIQLWTGKLRAQIGTETAKKMKFRTPTAVAGIRGTEFFLLTDGENDTVCVLEGHVEVTVEKTGETLSISEGRGLKLISGRRSQVAFNSDSQVRQWTNDTSFEDTLIIPPLYEASVPTKRVDEQAYFNGTLQILSRYNSNYDFDHDRERTQDALITQTRLEPAFSYGTHFIFFASPIIYKHNSTEKSTTDSYPLLQTDQKTGIAWGRLYLEYQQPEYQIQAGSLRVKWNEGTQVTDATTRLDQNSLVGGRARSLLGDWGAEALWTQGLRDEANNGLSHISYRGIKIDTPKDWGNVFFVNRYYGDKSQLGGVSSLETHDTYDYGLYSEKRFGTLEYKVSFSYQTGKMFRGEAAESALKEATTDLAFRAYGRYFKNIRTEVRYIAATEDYLPGEESLYGFGLANIVSRTNLVQFRYKLDWLAGTKHLLSLEYLTSNSMGQSHLSSLGWVGKETIGNEWNLIYNWKIASDLNWMLGGFHFTPGKSLKSVASAGTKTDPAFGGVTRLNFAF